MSTYFKARWRDDPLRWNVTSGTIFSIIDNAETNSDDSDPSVSPLFEKNGMMPTDIVTELIRVSRKYKESDNSEIRQDAQYLLVSTPAIMGLISVLAGSKPLQHGVPHSARKDEGPLAYLPNGRIRLTEYGKEELARIYAEFTKRIGVDIDKKHVDMNDPILRWSPPKGWGVSESKNNQLPPKREIRQRLTYRQWLMMLHKESKVWVTAQEDLMAEPRHPKGSPEAEIVERRIKSRHAQIKNVRTFAKLVLSGGPDSIWIGKPLVPKDVHNDTESFYASGKAGFTPQIVEASSLAWELWETDEISLGEYVETREWLHLKLTEEREISKKLSEDSAAGLETDSKNRPVAYRRMSNRSEESSVKLYESYDPLAVNHPMDFAPNRMAIQIANPEEFVQVNKDGAVSHTRCDFVYSMKSDANDPGHVSYSRKGGTRCPNLAVFGTTRCEMHGGMLASPAETRSMIVASQMQAFALAGQAMATIADIMMNGQTEAVRLRAAETVLNRSGVIEGAEIDLNMDKKGDSTENDARDIVMDRLKRLAQFDDDEKSDDKPDEDVIEGSVEEVVSEEPLDVEVEETE